MKIKISSKLRVVLSTNAGKSSDVGRHFPQKARPAWASVCYHSTQSQKVRKSSQLSHFLAF